MSEHRTEGAGETPPAETGNGETLAQRLRSEALKRIHEESFLTSNGLAFAARMAEEEAVRLQPGGLVEALRADAETGGKWVLSIAREHEARWQADRAAWEAKQNALLGKCAEWELLNYDGFADAVREILSDPE